MLYMIVQSRGWRTGLQFLAEIEFLSSPPHPEKLWGPQPLSNGYKGSLG